MRRIAVVSFLTLALAATPAPAQHASQGGEASHGDSSHASSDIWWKWVNFAILAGALGYLIRKKAPAFFAGRDEQIRQGIEEATRLRKEAEEHAAGIERRLANLALEIEAMRREAQEEMAAESERTRQETEQALGKVAVHAEQEIDAAAKAAVMELRAHAAELALKLAEQRVRDRMTPGADEVLLRSFVHDLERRASGRPPAEAS